MRHYKSYITMALAACTLSLLLAAMSTWRTWIPIPQRLQPLTPTHSSRLPNSILMVTWRWVKLTVATFMPLISNWWAAGILRIMVAAIHLTLTRWGISGRTTIENIKDLTDAQARTTDDDEKVNINAAVRIYRVYLMSHLTDIYGDVPYFEAGKALLMVSSRLDMTRKKRYTMTFCGTRRCRNSFWWYQGPHHRRCHL